MKRKVVLLILVLMLCLTCLSCNQRQADISDVPSSSVFESSSGSSSESVPPKPVPQIKYPDALQPGVIESVAYKSAMEQGMLLIGAEEPATDAVLATWFLGQLADGCDAEMAMCRFYVNDVDGRYFALLFISRGGELFVRDAGGSLNEAVAFGEAQYAVKGAQINPYGYFVCDTSEFSDPFSFKAMHDREIYPNSDEAKEVYQKYLRPIFYTALGGGEWASANELDRWIWLFEDIYFYEGNDPWQEFGSDWPLDVMVNTLSRYFDDITPELVKRDKGGEYKASTNTIFYEGGRGGGPKPLRVLDWETKADTLVIRYAGFEYATGVPYDDEYLLTVRLLPDGGFRYVSNLITNS